MGQGEFFNKFNLPEFVEPVAKARVLLEPVQPAFGPLEGLPPIFPGLLKIPSRRKQNQDSEVQFLAGC